jgi:hypothetical protein
MCKDCGLHLHLQPCRGIASHCHIRVLHFKLNWVENFCRVLLYKVIILSDNNHLLDLSAHTHSRAGAGSDKWWLSGAVRIIYFLGKRILCNVCTCYIWVRRIQSCSYKIWTLLNFILNAYNWFPRNLVYCGVVESFFCTLEGQTWTVTDGTPSSGELSGVTGVEVQQNLSLYWCVTAPYVLLLPEVKQMAGYLTYICI